MGSAVTVAELAVKISADGIEAAKRGLGDVQKAGKEAESGALGLGDAFGKLNVLLGAAGLGLSLGALAKGLYSVNAEQGKLLSQLQTFEGSAAGARAVFKDLADFANTTPAELPQVVRAYATLRSAGITPTMESLRLFGDQASAFNKNIEDVAEAIRSATTGEFRPLKEFGVQMHVEGDKIIAQYEGVRTTIGRDSADIVHYLEDLSRVKFSGAMERESHTLSGAMSTLSDAIAQVGRDVGDSGLGADVVTLVVHLTDLITVTDGARSSFGRMYDYIRGGSQVLYGTGKLLNALGALLNPDPRSDPLTRLAALRDAYTELRATQAGVAQHLDVADARDRAQDSDGTFRLGEGGDHGLAATGRSRASGASTAPENAAAARAAARKAVRDAQRAADEARAEAAFAALQDDSVNRRNGTFGTLEQTTDVGFGSLLTAQKLKRGAQDLEPLTRSLKGTASGALEFLGNKEELAKLAHLVDLRDNLASGIGDAVTGGLAAGFEAAFSGGNPFSALAGAMLSGLGSAVEQFGLGVVATAPLMLTIQGALRSLNPAVALPAGIALVALGAGMKSLASRAFGGGSGGSGGGGFSGGYGGGSASGAVPDIIDRGIIAGAYGGLGAAAIPTSAQTSGRALGTPTQPITVQATIIGPDDPGAQRGITELIRAAVGRGLTAPGFAPA